MKANQEEMKTVKEKWVGKKEAKLESSQKKIEDVSEQFKCAA
jgi:hypothetical protein